MYFFLPFHWPRVHHVTSANNCLQISILLQIIFCSCVIETTLLCENGRSVPWAGREWFVISWSKEWWSNDKTIIIELGYCKISWFLSVASRSIIIVNYWTLVTLFWKMTLLQDWRDNLLCKLGLSLQAIYFNLILNNYARNVQAKFQSA